MRNILIANRLLFKIILILTICSIPATLIGQNIYMTNTYQKVSYNRFNWQVFIVASRADINSIEYVEYTLHSSFPNPIRRRINRNQNFALSTNGWGEFDILAKVAFRDNRTIFLTYRLNLSNFNDPYRRINTANSARYFGRSRGEWRIFLTGPQNVLNTIRYVDYYLHPTFPNPIRRINTRGNGFLLYSSGWGSFTAGINVFFNNGSTRYLKHRLRFPQ